MDQIIKEIEPLAPDQKKAFLSRLRDGMRCRGIFGMVGSRGHKGRWKNNKKDEH